MNPLCATETSMPGHNTKSVLMDVSGHNRCFYSPANLLPAIAEKGKNPVMPPVEEPGLKESITCVRGISLYEINNQALHHRRQLEFPQLNVLVAVDDGLYVYFIRT